MFGYLAQLAMGKRHRQSPELSPDSPMDKMKKILSSPITRKRNLQAGRYFGVHLEDLAKREGDTVPTIVRKVCHFIQNHGIGQEGIFRVNGNARVVDKLKGAFEKCGDADLEEAGDVMAVAGLLKMFLRELPDSVIPDSMTKLFISTQEEFSKDRKICNEKTRLLLAKLPKPNYDLLKYLCHFLVLVSLREDTNKMSPMALGIVFGPNLFRCSGGIEGLREQGVTNQIVLRWIVDYDTLFLQENEVSPYSSKLIKVQEAKKRTPPARPPPPNFDASHSPPVPSPRKSKPKVNNSVTHDSDELDHSDETTTPRSGSNNTPRFSDDEYAETFRSSSPFVLDSDRSESSAVTSPSPAASQLAADQKERNPRLVERAIKDTVAEHLFGDLMGNTASSSDEGPPDHKSAPVPAPRKVKRRDKPSRPNLDNADESPDERTGDDEEDQASSVKQRIRQFEVDEDSTSTSDSSKPVKRQRPASKAFDMFESQGIVIGPASESMSRTLAGKHDLESDDLTPSQSPSSTPAPRARSPKAKRMNLHGREGLDDDVPGLLDRDDSGFGSIQRTTTTLSSFKRAPGPKNRRTPSRKSLKMNLSTGQLGERNHLDHIEEHDEFDSGFGYDNTQHNHTSEDFNHNATKPSIGFLDIHHNGTGAEHVLSPDRSPTMSRKPYVPPLDLSILHEHGDGSDPILAEQGPSLAFQKARSFKDEEDVILSPRATKLKKKSKHKPEGPLSPSAFRIIAHSSAHHDTDVPPSPPTEQPVYVKGGKRPGDKQAQIVRQLTKKIQSCKKKIKVFEEAFEEQHGYRPSQSDKASRADIKRCMQELAKARKDLKHTAHELSPQGSFYEGDIGHVFRFETDTIGRFHPLQDAAAGEAAEGWPSGMPEVREELENSERLADPLPGSSVDLGRDDGITMEHPTMQDTLDMLLRRLKDKRRDGNRPEDLTLMTRDQVQEEKLSIQKALLHFENIHGRPTTKFEKELMRPLYDRYRNVKRLLSKTITSPREKTKELQPVPEDKPIEFSPSTSAQSSTREPIRVPTGNIDDDHEGGSMDFMVTRDLGLLLKNTLMPVDHSNDVEPHNEPPPDPNSPPPQGDGPWTDSESNLHELPVSKLLDEQQKARLDKKKLRKILRDFEEDFFRQTGRKVQKDDRAPMEAEYNEYKQIKARLKLLDALLSKHDPTSPY